MRIYRVAFYVTPLKVPASKEMVRRGGGGVKKHPVCPLGIRY